MKDLSENNKLIVNFMGGFITEDGYRAHLPILDQETRIHNVMGSPPSRLKEAFEIKYTHELEYHKSWDWIMPVVDKIENLSVSKFQNISIGSGEVSIAFANENPPNEYLFIYIDFKENKLNTVYEAVVEFIKWYNRYVMNTYHYSISGGAFHLPFDYGVVEAKSKEDARAKSVAEIKEALAQYDLDWIDFDADEIEIE